MKRKMLVSFLSILIFTYCNTSQKLDTNRTQSSLNIENIIGTYVSEDYFKRSEGYDWIAVTISKLGDLEAQIKIRSRIDNKKATCTFDGIGLLTGQDTLTAEYENKSILFYIKNERLIIKAKKEEDSTLLYYFCSGGASMAGKYIKLDEPLDQSQLLNFGFSKKLSLQNINFLIKSTNEGSLNTLIIKTEGLEIKIQDIILEIDGNVTNAEIEDLNSDGWPEILIYTTSAGSGSYGSVIGYSVDKGKSMSKIYFPNIAENDKINKGYMGHDEFSIIETSLVQRFPVYKIGDVNAKPSGKIRQIKYKLINEKDSKVFKYEKSYEF
ncbi:MAG: PliI family lysozyme inhibitor of I-type lysozyme [Melioribacteraceae bacterium]|nr:PliI family lysozyme inhibitor of I-type lysozyme [Melioribacteraceae bacterium]